MIQEKRCSNCMTMLGKDATVCPHCGQPVDTANAEDFLPVGSKLCGKYIIGKMISYSGATARYVGFDEGEYSPIYIYEYMPKGLCFREESGNLAVAEMNRESFTQFKNEFSQNIRAIAKLRDLSIMLPIFDIFEENNTIYAVGEYMDPRHSLADTLRVKGGRLNWEETRTMIMPFVSSLISCHAAGVTHFGICPSNLLVGTDGKLRLIGFDIAEVRIKDSALDSQIAEGYAAPEQYRLAARPDPASDVYAVCAVIFRILSGSMPPSGEHRKVQGNDLLLPADVAEIIPPHVTAAISDGMQPQLNKRISSMTELKERLATGAIVHALADETKILPVDPEAAHPLTEEKETKKKGLSPWIIALIVVGSIFLICLIVVLKINSIGSKNNPSGTEGSEVSFTALPTAATTTENKLTSEIPKMNDGTIDYYGLEITNDIPVYRGFPIEIAGLRYDENIDAGFIIAQDPAPGTKVEPNTIIKVTLSAGKEVTIIPDVIGWDGEHAQLYLEALGFRVDISEEDNASVNLGCVCGTWPDVGESPDPSSGNKVTLRINRFGTTAPEIVEENNTNTDDVIPEE